MSIDDTLSMMKGLWTCNQNQDTCPNDPGNDPVTNYMNYQVLVKMNTLRGKRIGSII